MSLDLSDLPRNAVTQTFAFVARRGAGKTYAASRLAETMLERGDQIVAIDPVGVWWGLRLAPNAKDSGFAIPVFGGLHGDLPLEPGAGELMAHVVVERGTSAVLDVSMFRKGDRKTFVTAFAETLFHLKKSKRSPIHIFLEEAQVFVPQRVMGDEARMLGAFEDLVKLGRNFGIGITLISQRPQAVNKDALNQTECLVVLQTNGSQERKAIEQWIVDQGLDSKDLVRDLPSLPVGTAWLWSPQWLGKLEKIKVSKRVTFNASATPTGSAERDAAPKPLEPHELEAIREQMSEVVKKAQADDPKALRRRIAELEMEIRNKAPPIHEVKEVVKEVPALTASQKAYLESQLPRLSKAIQDLTERLTPKPTIIHVRNGISAASESTDPVWRAPQNGARTISDERAGAGERKMLAALASRPEPLTKPQLGVLAGYAASGGTFRTYLPRLKRLGWVEETRDGRITLTQEGRKEAGDVRPTVSIRETQDQWRQALGAGERRLLDVLLESYPNGLSKEELGQKSGYEAAGGTFRTYLPRLKRLGLVDDDNGQLRAAEALFLSRAQ